MAEIWKYYVPFAVQAGNKIGLSAKIIPLPHRLDSEETVVALINALTFEVFPDGVPDEFRDGKTLPVTPLGWELLTAQSGPGVKGNGHDSDP